MSINFLFPRTRPQCVSRRLRIPRAASPLPGLALGLFLSGFAPHAGASAPVPLAPSQSGPTLRLTAQGGFQEGKTAPRAGDTLRYRLRVAWTEVPAAILPLPAEMLEAPGFMPAGRSTSHRKTAANGSILNTTEYTYLLVAREEGVARVSPFMLRYHNGLTGREESVNVPGAMLDITAARKPLAQRAWFRILALAALVAAATAVVRRLRHVRKGKRTKAAAAQSQAAAAPPYEAEISALRRRCDTAESRAWLADAEKLCIVFLSRRLGIANPGQVRFEAALDQYQARHPSLDPGVSAAWAKLKDLFHEARYAGGRREPHVLREACHHLAVCLQHQGEKKP